MGDLLPCPFCGGNADYLKVYAPRHEEGHDNRWRVRCEHGCGAMVPSFVGQDKAAAAWNRRDPPPQPRTEGKP
ncbi:MAG: hypothetical protein DI604_31550 [Delftia acidovorans]|nr:MAG: hypothetical protein DI604_31550 [Delftia acidovorans]